MYADREGVRDLKMSMPLFDRLFAGTPAPTGPPLTGADLRDSGIESVLSHTPEEYKVRFIEAVKSFPVGHLITTEDIRERAGDPPPETHYNCMGGLIRRAVSQKLIEPTGKDRNAKRPSLHATKLAIWRRV